MTCICLNTTHTVTRTIPKPVDYMEINNISNLYCVIHLSPVIYTIV